MRARLLARLTGMFMVLLLSAASAQPPGGKLTKEWVAEIVPGMPIDDLRPSPVPGLYEVVSGTTVFYLSEDGRYLLSGDLLSVEREENLTEQARARIRLNLIGEVAEQTMIIFSPPAPKRTMTVFTDVDCPYCAKLHRDVPKLVEAGVRVRYLSFPRTGIGSPSYRRAVAVWCADDPKKAMGIAKAKGKLEMKTCTNPVADHYRLGLRLGVQGTPSIVFDDGRMIAGYYPPERYLQMLGLGASSQPAGKK